MSGLASNDASANASSSNVVFGVDTSAKILGARHVDFATRHPRQAVPSSLVQKQAEETLDATEKYLDSLSMKAFEGPWETGALGKGVVELQTKAKVFRTDMKALSTEINEATIEQARLKKELDDIQLLLYQKQVDKLMSEKKSLRAKAVISAIKADYQESVRRMDTALRCISGGCAPQEEKVILERTRAHTLGLPCDSNQPNLQDFSVNVSDKFDEADKELNLELNISDPLPIASIGHAEQWKGELDSVINRDGGGVNKKHASVDPETGSAALSGDESSEASNVKIVKTEPATAGQSLPTTENSINAEAVDKVNMPEDDVAKAQGGQAPITTVKLPKDDAAKAEGEQIPRTSEDGADVDTDDLELDEAAQEDEDNGLQAAVIPQDGTVGRSAGGGLVVAESAQALKATDSTPQDVQAAVIPQEDTNVVAESDKAAVIPQDKVAEQSVQTPSQIADARLKEDELNRQGDASGAGTEQVSGVTAAILSTENRDPNEGSAKDTLQAKDGFKDVDTDAEREDIIPEEGDAERQDEDSDESGDQDTELSDAEDVNRGDENALEDDLAKDN